MAIYFISLLDIHDSQGFGEYVPRAASALSAAGGEILALDDNPVTHEGTLPGSRVILLKFEDKASFEKWYEGEAYRPVKPIRLNSAITHFGATVQGMK
ncbi:uncharacterized protein (DUF1330 family) [Silvibacterium bohemicum]|uniref:Uncharacterized protein (DUF1330 family) n=1 Tax=Silvibacterium bohemicum TaxID=1577686 RepID=A0A841JSN1_9BACT|nr:DUF1330 domain-containing protein [Silvibacterium bohemicum]MBB6144160.1 uncharacterized protein (DUF1330 family) [Silvibacterium bohemicum]